VPEAPQKSGGMVAAMKFFEMKVGEFRKEWQELTDADKKQLVAGIENGSLTY
jgi:hypothetical protein